jgi:hypothetical protein
MGMNGDERRWMEVDRWMLAESQTDVDCDVRLM